MCEHLSERRTNPIAVPLSLMIEAGSSAERNEGTDLSADVDREAKDAFEEESL